MLNERPLRHSMQLRGWLIDFEKEHGTMFGI